LALLPLQRFARRICNDHLFGERRITRYNVRAIFGDCDRNALLATVILYGIFPIVAV
jgi:hypothetical protein